MSMRRRIWWLLVFGAALIGLAGCQAQEEGVNLFDLFEEPASASAAPAPVLPLILTHSAPEGSLTDQMAQMLKEKVEEGSQGEIQLQIYPSDSLGSLDDGRWHFDNGAVDMRIGAGPNSAMMVATWLPTLLDCTELQIRQGLQPGGALRELLCQEENGAYLLGIPLIASRVLTSSQPIENLCQLDGLMVRIIPNSNLDKALWTLLGAQTVEVPIRQLPLALQQGQADAQDNPVYLIHSHGLAAHQRWLIPINLKLYMESIFINQQVYDQMSPAHRAALDQAVREVEEEMPQLASQYNDACQDIFLREGLQLRPVSQQERQELRQTVIPMLEQELVKRYGQELYQSVLDSMAEFLVDTSD